MIISITVVWCVHKKRERKSSTIKHVSSTISLSAIPSDYVDESERTRLSPNVSMTSLERLSHFCFPKIQVIDFFKLIPALLGL